MSISRNTLIYDADCGFCQNGVDKLKSIMGGTIDYLPRTELKDGDYGIDSDSSTRAIQFIVIENNQYIVYSAAEAVFRAVASKLGFLLWCYKYLPGFAWVSEQIYLWVAANRKSSCKI